MRILYVSYFCPPEVAAPASRVIENASRLSRAGHDVTILTGFPNHPTGRLFPGYHMELSREERIDGVRIVRVPSWLAPNTSTANRLKGYLSLMAAQVLGSLRIGPADIVIGTSPPLFQALAGQIIATLKRAKFVMEVRDLWPENMVAIGALKSGLGVRAMYALEAYLYRRADHVVTVTEGFRRYVIERGTAEGRVGVVTNGVDISVYRPAARSTSTEHELGLDGAFTVGYLGTIGINHGLRTILEAADALRQEPDVRFLIVGDGAERRTLESEAHDRGLGNVIFLGERRREEMPTLHALCDATLVLLRDAPYFRTVIPSKIFISMALGCPIILGVDGEARRIVESAGAGVFVQPDSAEDVAAAVRTLRRMKAEGTLVNMGASAREYVALHYDRDRLAVKLEAILTATRES